MLSRRDAEKWEFDEGDVVVIIGGRSRNSRLFDLTTDETVADAVEKALRYEGRDVALEALSTFEYDVGDAGWNGPNRQSRSTAPTNASRLKREVDNGQRDHDDYEVLRDVSGRLLSIGGWDKAWSWIEDTFGDEFDPEVTHKYLSTFVDAGYDEIDPPDPP